MRIKVTELEQVLSIMFAELREQNGEEIEIDNEDFYWSISKNDLYNPYIQPDKLTLGQISDDLDHIHKLAEKRLPIVGYDFVKMSSIFQLIGNKSSV
jgi:hypothetical protein